MLETYTIGLILVDDIITFDNQEIVYIIVRCT
jgi:hypothetical protein